MCYDTAQLAYRIYKDAKRLNASDDEIKSLYDKWKKLKGEEVNYYHVNGFDHPKLLCFTMKDGSLDLNFRVWGLIPHWIQDEERAREIWNGTLLSRAESMNEKSAFKDAVKSKRCIVPLDGFYEHFHKNGKTYPHFIKSQNDERLFIGGLTSEWLNTSTGDLIETLCLVTTKANDFMARIHNNPKLKEGRMPFILEEENAIKWLDDNQCVDDLVKTNNVIQLKSWTVNKIRGKSYIGNKLEVQDKREYVELIDPLELF